MVRLVIVSVCAALVAGCTTDAPPAADDDASAATTIAFNVEGGPTVAFAVPDMMCEQSCAAKVREVLSQQPGVREVNVDFPTKTATVVIDQAEFDADQAVAVLADDYGFANTHLKTP